MRGVARAPAHERSGVKKTTARAGKPRRKQGETRLAGPERDLKLPHERDESAQPPGPRQRIIKQAAKDLAAGMIDTDNYTRVAEVAAQAETRRRRGS